MLPRNISFALFGLGLLCSAQTWKLPQGVSVKDAGPRTYRFTVTYNTANTTGEIIRRNRLTGEYTRGLANQEVVWKNVSEANANGATGAFDAPEKRGFMENFRYHDDAATTFTPDFFKAFPPTAVLERNLVWDTVMIESFGQDFFDRLELNKPYQSLSKQDVDMPGVGKFRNRNVVLQWIGNSTRNGQDCALIQYQAFFNPLEINNGGMNLKGRSDYWGEIWVSLKTKQIEYATIYENLTGEMKIAGQENLQPISVFRTGTFEPVGKQL
jgi:hypothetical protein